MAMLCKYQLSKLSTIFFIHGTIILCLYGYALNHFYPENACFRIVKTLLLQTDLQRLFFGCIVLWCFSTFYLSFQLKDLPLLGLLLVGVCMSFLYKQQAINSISLFGGITYGKCVNILAQNSKNEKTTFPSGYYPASHCRQLIILTGFVLWLAFASFWHLDMSKNYYHGLRWMGIWDNPNTYGMLMGAGVLLAVGLLTGMRSAESAFVGLRRDKCGMQNFKEKRKSAWGSWNLALRVFIWIATVMMGVGLVMSYSRGAWLATGAALVYLAWCYGKLKWRYVGIGVGLVVLGVLLFWSRTPDSAPWYVKRADLGRPSAQHRVVAWEAGLKIMQDHPFGVGWNNAVSTYEKNYSPPENGAEALTTNDYLMIGTELGIPALLCFVIYTALCLRGKPTVEMEAGGIQAACRAGAIVFLVSFWFDGGLFKLPTAALFWVLLELGAERRLRLESCRLQVGAD